MDESVAPLQVFSASRAESTFLLCNAKSRAKSIERGELWFLTASGRVLPAWGGGCSSSSAQPVAAHGSTWYEVELRGPLPDTPVGGDAGRAGAAPAGGRDPAESDGDAAAASVTDRGDVSGIISRLEATIAARRATMPEGSYTTHLFRKGRDKIRKKLGEEAIELVLADDDASVASEAADLVYHLLVLLVERDQRFSAVLTELDSRH